MVAITKNINPTRRRAGSAYAVNGGGASVNVENINTGDAGLVKSLEASDLAFPVPAWVASLPVAKDILADRRAKYFMLRLTQIGSLSFLAALAIMIVKNPPYFGVIMNCAGRQLALASRNKICRHQIAGEKLFLAKR
jgi:hypothetical protein